jgi:hypothetical protein
VIEYGEGQEVGSDGLGVYHVKQGMWHSIKFILRSEYPTRFLVKFWY